MLGEFADALHIGLQGFAHGPTSSFLAPYRDMDRQMSYELIRWGCG
jgi:hypothetical protein